MKKLLFLTMIIAFAVFVLSACGDEQGEDVSDVQAAPGTQDTASADVAGASGAPDATDVSGGDNSDAAPSETNDDAPSPDDAMQGDEPQSAPYFSFQMGDVVIEMDQDINYVIERFGEPRGVFEQPSCAFDGIDRIFDFPGVQIYTYPKGDADHIHTISLRDDSVRSLEGGIRLGSSLQTVLDAYGDDYVYDSGMYTFTRGLTTLEFLIADGVVIGITYGFIIE